MSMISDYYRHQIEAAEREVSRIDDSDLMEMDTEELVDTYTRRIELPLIVEDDTREPSWEALKSTVIHTSNNMPIGRRLNIRIHYPVVPHEKIGYVLNRRATRARTHTYDYSGGTIQFTMDFGEGDGVQTERINRRIDELREEIGWKNNDVKTGNENTRKELRNYIEQRKKRVESDHALLEKIVGKDTPLTKKEKGARNPCLTLRT